MVTGASQFGANRAIGFAGHHEEDRVGAGVRIEPALVDQRVEDRLRETAPLDEVATHALEVRKARGRQVELSTSAASSGTVIALVCQRPAATGG